MGYYLKNSVRISGQQFIAHTFFLKWLLLYSLVFSGVITSFYFDLFSQLWQKDVTKLSFLIISMYVVMSTWCGVKIFLISDMLRRNKVNGYLLEKVIGKEETGWFVSDLMTSIGMIGTVIGFIIMLGSLHSVDASNIHTVRQMFNTLGSGMAVALLTTLVGLICSSLLKVQYFILSRGIEDNFDKDEV